MAVDFADIDRDGYVDFFVADMYRRSHLQRMKQRPVDPIPNVPEEFVRRPQIRQNTLWRNRGDGTFAEIAEYAGVAASDWSWTSVFLDVDLDGYEDLLVANGHQHDAEDLDAIDQAQGLAKQTPRTGRGNLRLFPPILVPNAAWRNNGNLQFEDASEFWNFNSLQVSHGMALADLDNDGDQDVVINCLNAPPLIYPNETVHPRVAVRLRDQIHRALGQKSLSGRRAFLRKFSKLSPGADTFPVTIQCAYSPAASKAK